MTERSENFMKAVWEARNNHGADTEEKLVAAVLQIAAENVQAFTAQDGRIVLDKTDLLNLSEELNS
jgi:hypothetical protein